MLHDIGTLAFLGLILVPFYLLLNQYWKSLVLLIVGYGLLAFAFLRLGRYMRRVMRRAPAEIPPWQPITLQVPTFRPQEIQFAAAEAIQHVCQDPHYLEEVLKPRLRRLLVYRIRGGIDKSLETLDATHKAQLDPAVLDFLCRYDNTGLWVKYWHRQKRLQDVLKVLRYLEAL